MREPYIMWNTTDVLLRYTTKRWRKEPNRCSGYGGCNLLESLFGNINNRDTTFSWENTPLRRRQISRRLDLFFPHSSSSGRCELKKGTRTGEDFYFLFLHCFSSAQVHRITRSKTGALTTTSVQYAFHSSKRYTVARRFRRPWKKATRFELHCDAKSRIRKRIRAMFFPPIKETSGPFRPLNRCFFNFAVLHWQIQQNFLATWIFTRNKFSTNFSGSNGKLKKFNTTRLSPVIDTRKCNQLTIWNGVTVKHQYDAVVHVSAKNT